MRVLITGWFSTEDGEITAGDVLAGDTVRRWLAEAGIPHDVALAAAFRGPGDVGAGEVDPARYSDVLFVCGPTASAKVEALLERFAGARRVAVGVSLVDGGAAPFDALLPRDGGGEPRVDLSLPAPARAVPVVAVVLAHRQEEYGAGQRHEAAERLVRAALRRVDVAPLPVDTRLDADDELMCSTADALQSLLTRADAVVTTRLHGLVLALRGGVPAVALDPIAGGAKVAAQARALGWPAACTLDDADAGELAEHLAWCLSAEGRAQAAACARRGREAVAGTRDELLELLAG